MGKQIDPGAILKVGFNTPFAGQIEFFRRKLDLPTEHWDDILRAAHDRAFIVAGAMKADLLADLRGAVDKSIAEGQSLGWFRKEFAAIVGRHGWQGWTGEGSPAGFAWRTRIIYQTNLATSYAAGRYRQLTDPELLKLRPYWRYKHADNVANPRQQHVAWNGLTLAHDHPFWKTHFPPNGWGCHCRVVPVGRRDYAQAEAAGLTEPPKGWDDYPEGGDPPGIARGFGYAPGASVADDLRALVAAKAKTLPAPLAQALADDVSSILPRQARSVAEASRIAKEIIGEQGKAWVEFGSGAGPVVRFAHVGAPSRNAVIAKRLGKADLSGLDVDTANAVNTRLVIAQNEADRLGIPRLRGVTTAVGQSGGSMGDGILAVSKKYRINGTPLQPPSTYQLSDGNHGRPVNAREYFATNEERIERMIWHEFGHHIHQTFQVDSVSSYLHPPLEARLSEIILDQKRRFGALDFPSEYAKENFKEYFAETYCLHKMGRDDLVPSFMKDVIAKIERGEMP